MHWFPFWEQVQRSSWFGCSMALDYTALKATALALLTENGTTMQIHRTGAATGYTRYFDEGAGRIYWELDSDPGVEIYTAPTDSMVITSGKGVISSWPRNQVDGTLIQVDDLRVVISIELQIQLGDILVTAAGREFRILPPIEIVAPTESIVLVQVVNARL